MQWGRKSWGPYPGHLACHRQALPPTVLAAYDEGAVGPFENFLNVPTTLTKTVSRPHEGSWSIPLGE